LGYSKGKTTLKVKPNVAKSYAIQVSDTTILRKASLPGTQNTAALAKSEEMLKRHIVCREFNSIN